MNPSELQSGRGAGTGHLPTEMAMICTRSRYPSGVFMPCKVMRQQGLSCLLADGMQVEKATSCLTECKDGE